MMEIIWDELTAGLPNKTQLVHTIIRLVAAALLGGIVGWQREWAGKSAGLRTHILVSLGTTVFVLAAAGSGMSPDGVSRVIQGLVTGIVFIGAGAILKLSQTREIQGLTTVDNGCHWRHYRLGQLGAGPAQRGPDLGGADRGEPVGAARAERPFQTIGLLRLRADLRHKAVA